MCHSSNCVDVPQVRGKGLERSRAHAGLLLQGRGSPDALTCLWNCTRGALEFSGTQAAFSFPDSVASPSAASSVSTFQIAHLQYAHWPACDPENLSCVHGFALSLNPNAQFGWTSQWPRPRVWMDGAPPPMQAKRGQCLWSTLWASGAKWLFLASYFGFVTAF